MERKYSDEEIVELWHELEDIPLYEDEVGNEYLLNDWFKFKKGTDRIDIWHWFDGQYSKGIYGLVNL